jgi:hypothetical protein
VSAVYVWRHGWWRCYGTAERACYNWGAVFGGEGVDDLDGFDADADDLADEADDVLFIVGGCWGRW